MAVLIVDSLLHLLHGVRLLSESHATELFFVTMPGFLG